MILKLIGFWSSPEELEEFIDPRLLVSFECEDNLSRIAGYLSSGFFCGGELGYSWCRFCCSTPSNKMGSSVLTDGKWCWPKGLVHYVLEHKVGLPGEFISHMQQSNYCISKDFDDANLFSAIQDLTFWDEWCKKNKLEAKFLIKEYDPNEVDTARRIEMESRADPLGLL